MPYDVLDVSTWPVMSQEARGLDKKDWITHPDEVRTNGELRQLTVSGIVRAEDISSGNTIRHTQIAEARISYGGRGDISTVQRTPAGTAILQRINPF